MANDPNTIQYVIQEDGFWYIASKDRTPGVPGITVSSNGIANGLSTEYNDGCDFGPDSYNPSVTSGVPLTQTSGIQEAINYGILYNHKILFRTGIYDLSNAPINQSSTGQNPYIIGFSGVSGGNSLLFIEGETVNNPFMEAQTSSNQKQGVIIYCGNNTTTLTDMFQVFSNGTSSNAITVHLKNIGVRGHSSGYINPLNAEYATSLYIDGTISVDTDASDTPPSISNSTGVIFPIASNISYSYADTVIVTGYMNGIQIGGHTYIDKLFEDYVLYGVVCGKTGVTTGYESKIGVFDVQYCGQAITAQSSISLYVASMMPGDGTSGQQTGEYANPDNDGYFSYVYDTNNYLYGEIDVLPYLSDALQLAGPSWFIGANLKLKGLSLSLPSASISTNPPVSATAYQNTNSFDIRIYLPVYATTAGTAGTVAYGEDPSSTVTEMTARYVNGATSSTAVDIVELVVPAGHYYKFTASGVTFGTATVKAV